MKKIGKGSIAIDPINGSATKFLNQKGEFAVPAGGGEGVVATNGRTMLVHNVNTAFAYTIIKDKIIPRDFFIAYNITDLTGVVFENCDLTDVVFVGYNNGSYCSMTLRRVEFINCIMGNVDFGCGANSLNFLGQSYPALIDDVVFNGCKDLPNIIATPVSFETYFSFVQGGVISPGDNLKSEDGLLQNDARYWDTSYTFPATEDDINGWMVETAFLQSSDSNAFRVCGSYDSTGFEVTVEDGGVSVLYGLDSNSRWTMV